MASSLSIPFPFQSISSSTPTRHRDTDSDGNYGLRLGFPSGSRSRTVRRKLGQTHLLSCISRAIKHPCGPPGNEGNPGDVPLLLISKAYGLQLDVHLLDQQPASIQSTRIQYITRDEI